MKLFLDTASRDDIKQWMPTGIVDGVTTNPSLLVKEGASTREVLVDICSMVPGDVSIEVVKKTPQEVYAQAREIASLAKNAVVKIPFHQDYLPVISRLSKEGVPLNITLIFSLIQTLLVAKLNVRYISPFIGRIDDIDYDGLELIEKIHTMMENYSFASQILAASIRTVPHLHNVALIGADVATVPPKLLTPIMNHPLTRAGIEKFDADWLKLEKDELLS